MARTAPLASFQQEILKNNAPARYQWRPRRLWLSVNLHPFMPDLLCARVRENPTLEIGYFSGGLPNFAGM